MAEPKKYLVIARSWAEFSDWRRAAQILKEGDKAEYVLSWRDLLGQPDGCVILFYRNYFMRGDLAIIREEIRQRAFSQGWQTEYAP